MKNPLTDTISIFARTRPELEEFLLFSILVANKPADVTQKKLARLIAEYPGEKCVTYNNGYMFKTEWVTLSPFDRIRGLIRTGRFGRALRKHKIGQYKRIGPAIRAVVDKSFDVERCGIEELERIPGIGPKTSRFFILHTQEHARYAVLDTHILKWLRDVHVPNVPRSTPPKGPEYRRLENEFLKLADLRKMSPADLDYSVWVIYASKHRKKA